MANRSSSLPPAADKVKYCLENMWRDTKMQLMRLFHRRHKDNDDNDNEKYSDHFDDGWSLDGHFDKAVSIEGGSYHDENINTLSNVSRTFSASSTIASSILSSEDQHIKQRASPPPRAEFMSHLNSFDTGFIPPEGKLRDDWTRYVQLAHCSRWALDSVFTSKYLSYLVLFNAYIATIYYVLKKCFFF